MDNDLDFVGIGDIVTDAFIRLREAKAMCDIHDENCTITMKFKQKIPYDSVTVVPAVGNSANAAVAAARLGLKSALVTDVGGDRNADEAIEALQKNGVDTGFVRKHEGQKTNYHYVLWYESDRTILIKHELFERTFPNLGTPRWMYLSSLGENSLPFHDVIADYLDAHPQISLSFQPGTFQIRFGVERLIRLYQRAAIFASNTDEVQAILKTSESDPKKLLLEVAALGPKIVLITDGPKGAYVYDGSSMWFMPPYPDVAPPFERTGAGDAFTSTFTAAIAMGKSVPEALSWAPINAMSVVQHIGAQEGLLTKALLEDYLTKAPEDYKPQQL